MINGPRKMCACLIFVSVLLLTCSGHTDELKPFVSDGCSVFPDGTSRQDDLWLFCCVAHDRAYWQGGTRQERAIADEELRKCVDTVGAPKVANLMKVGARLGGNPYLPFHFRWGFGWPYLRGYKPLTRAERLMVEEEILAETVEE